MRTINRTVFASLTAGLVIAGAWTGTASEAQEPEATHCVDLAAVNDEVRTGSPVEKGLAWLVAAQNENGGWGAGSHSNQTLRDPHQVETDPATTAFAAMAVMRAGSTPTTGRHAESLRKATMHMVTLVEKYPLAGPRITDLNGTQPQVKMGHLVDTSMAVLFFSRLLPHLEDGQMRDRVDGALEKCLSKLQGAQTASGAWDQAGWAGVLQSSLGCSALEFARAAGKDVDEEMLSGAREYHRGNYDAKTGKAKAIDGAGIELYAYSSAQRAAAGEARAARDLIDKAKREGKLDADAPVSANNLAEVGIPAAKAASLITAYEQAEAQAGRLDDDQLLAGFGNTGGEEYVSYMLTSEALVITGGEAWDKWNLAMQEKLPTIQHADGSWSGLHCIVGPAFCTAAVLQCLTAEEDADLLTAISANDIEESKE